CHSENQQEQEKYQKSGVFRIHDSSSTKPGGTLHESPTMRNYDMCTDTAVNSYQQKTAPPKSK
ncbi:MAG TPA: hypothetical protein VFV07_00040, partial [Rhizomicrobium sp.]|nr:hypothetical protein [Rhizomicrobium sp.]